MIVLSLSPCVDLFQKCMNPVQEGSTRLELVEQYFHDIVVGGSTRILRLGNYYLGSLMVRN